MASRIAAAALAACISVTPLSLLAQSRGGGTQGRSGGGAPGGRQGGRGQLPPGGLTPRDIQAHFDAYVITEAERLLRISEEQYPQFVPRVRALQRTRREIRMQRNRSLTQLSQLLRADPVDEARLVAATKAIDEQERNSVAEIQKAYGAIDDVLTPWQRARFRVLEDQLEQKKLQMMMRVQGSRR